MFRIYECDILTTMKKRQAQTPDCTPQAYHIGVYIMNEKEKIREAALKLLDYQDRTSSELRDKLIKKGFSEDAVDEAVSSYEESGLVNDERYARLYAQSKLSAGKGSRWIKQKLREKGISTEITENALEELKDSESIEDESVLCLRKALSICGLSDRFEVDEYGEIVSALYDPYDTYSLTFADGSAAAGSDTALLRENDNEPVDYFSRKIRPGETDRNIIRKEREKAKASLTRRLISAGFPAGTVFETVRRISAL